MLESIPAWEGSASTRMGRVAGVCRCSRGPCGLNLGDVQLSGCPRQHHPAPRALQARPHLPAQEEALAPASRPEGFRRALRGAGSSPQAPLSSLKCPAPPHPPDAKRRAERWGKQIHLLPLPWMLCGSTLSLETTGLPTDPRPVSHPTSGPQFPQLRGRPLWCHPFQSPLPLTRSPGVTQLPPPGVLVPRHTGTDLNRKNSASDQLRGGHCGPPNQRPG